MRGQESLDQKSISRLDQRPERAPDGAGVMLAVLAGTLCWAGLFALFF